MTTYAKNKPSLSVMTVNEFRQRYPIAYAALRKQCFEKGVKMERERQLQLSKYVTPDTAEIIARARASGASISEVCQEIVATRIKGNNPTVLTRVADFHPTCVPSGQGGR